MRLSRATLPLARPGVALPGYDVARLKPGIVHLGLGAFHRAHQAVFTDDALAAKGGDWGIIGVSMRKPDVAASLDPQNGLYTVETLAGQPSYRIVGALLRSLTLPLDPLAVVEALASPSTKIITLTVTEKGYCLAGDSLDFDHPNIVHDLGDGPPTSAIGVLVDALDERRRRHIGPVTVISCDNLANNGRRLEAAVRAFAERKAPKLAAALDKVATFPETMVDCIVPASDATSRARVDAAIGLTDEASVQREGFAQWVIEDRFAGPRPAWPAGVEIVGKVGDYRRLKLHVLNAAHSALAYLGLRRGHTYVREAIADTELRTRLEAMIRLEVAPALPELAVNAYWKPTVERFANPMIDHRLDQIAQDGAQKLAERIYPLMQADLAAGRSAPVMSEVVRAWLERERPGADVE
ncbi:MAG: hypothetical protein BGN86_08980, partial [Caulobacterales bacterium 68-7]